MMYQQKIGLKIYWAWPHPSEKDRFPLSQSLPSLLSFYIRGQREWKKQIPETNNLITWATALSNSMKLWTMPCRATQDRQIMVECSDKMWSTGEGNGKRLQYSCLENPMDSMKRQKDRILKEELPRSVGAQYATGDQWRNNSRQSERWGQSKNKQTKHPVLDVSGDGSKVQCYKEQYCIGTWMSGPSIKTYWKWSKRRWKEWTSTF